NVVLAPTDNVAVVPTAVAMDVVVVAEPHAEPALAADSVKLPLTRFRSVPPAPSASVLPAAPPLRLLMVAALPFKSNPALASLPIVTAEPPLSAELACSRTNPLLIVVGPE